jgi:hypothetical protein
MSLNKLLAAVLVIIFLIFTLAAILIWSVGKSVLNADAYVDSLSEAGFFEVPYQLIREGDIPAAGGLLLKEGPLSVVSGVDLEAVARELAPPDWLRAQLERAIRDLITVAEAPELQELPELVISLREVKTRALSQPGNQALSLVVTALPECPLGQEPLDLSRETPVCRPAGTDLNPFIDHLKTLLAPFVERVPDTYRVRWPTEARDVLEDLQRAGRILDQLQFILLLFVALDLALLGLTWLLAVRSPAEWLRWTGVPLLLLGLLTLFLTLFIPSVVGWALDNQEFWTEGDLPAVLAQALKSAIQDFTTLLFRPAQLAGVITVVVGLLLTLVSPLFPGRRRRASVAPTRPVA